MSKDETPWRKLRKVLSPKAHKEKNRPCLSVPEPSHTPTASSSSVVSMSSQLEGNAALQHIYEREARREECSLWALAFESLQKANPDLIEKFKYCVGISSTEMNDKHFGHLRIDGVAREALKALEDANDTKKESSKTSAKIRKHFEQAVKVIFASKDFIASAVSANPYAALAWTGDSLLLPVSYFQRPLHITNDQIASPQPNPGERGGYEGSGSYCKSHDSLQVAGEDLPARARLRRGGDMSLHSHSGI